MDLFEEFYRYASLKLNKEKTEALTLQSTDCISNNLLGIKWIDCPFKTLGFWFSINYDGMFQLNTNEKMNIIQSIINSWSSRYLTIKGNITYYLQANGITDPATKKAVFLSSCGGSCYRLLRNVIAQEKPKIKILMH